ncbi:unnamed protein product [Nesidiocoris tenuis]|uniref:PHD-type domain-containing protein n=1 Tax=Nesidiocoris tenuis TaxID=355587 RepID=A0A6H5G6V2_9HEMI|nr:unnamed protein product [Nesidiocoris tenuis]
MTFLCENSTSPTSLASSSPREKLKVVCMLVTLQSLRSIPVARNRTIAGFSCCSISDGLSQAAIAETILMDPCTTCSNQIPKESEAALCSECKQIYHATCVGYSLENWSKEGSRKATWKCPKCKPPTRPKEQSETSQLQKAQSALYSDMKVLSNRMNTLEKKFDEVIDLIKIEQAKGFEAFQSDFKKIKDLYGTMNEKVTSLGQQLAQSSLQTSESVHQPGQTRATLDIAGNYFGNIPRFLEDKLRSVPKLKEHDPVSILKFLSALYDLNLIGENYFPEIIERLSTEQGIKFLQRLISESNDRSALTFHLLSRKVLDGMTTIKVRMTYQLEYLFRSQRPDESFREFVEDISKYSIILQSHQPAEIIEIILAGVNDATRGKFQFQTTPTTLQELDALINHVEKLEKSQAYSGMAKSREDLSDLSQFVKKSYTKQTSDPERPWKMEDRLANLDTSRSPNYQNFDRGFQNPQFSPTNQRRQNFSRRRFSNQVPQGGYSPPQGGIYYPGPYFNNFGQPPPATQPKGVTFQQTSKSSPNKTNPQWNRHFKAEPMRLHIPAAISTCHAEDRETPADSFPETRDLRGGYCDETVPSHHNRTRSTTRPSIWATCHCLPREKVGRTLEGF